MQKKFIVSVLVLVLTTTALHAQSMARFVTLGIPLSGQTEGYLGVVAGPKEPFDSPAASTAAPKPGIPPSGAPPAQPKEKLPNGIAIPSTGQEANLPPPPPQSEEKATETTPPVETKVANAPATPERTTEEEAKTETADTEEAPNAAPISVAPPPAQLATDMNAQEAKSMLKERFQKLKKSEKKERREIKKKLMELARAVEDHAKAHSRRNKTETWLPRAAALKAEALADWQKARGMRQIKRMNRLYGKACQWHRIANAAHEAAQLADKAAADHLAQVVKSIQQLPPLAD